MLRRTKTIVFNDDPDTDDTDTPASSARRDLGGRPSLRKGPVLMPREAETFLPQRESLGDQHPNAVHERQSFLRSEFENEPITRGSQDTLAALRADFRRKHVSVDEDESPGFSLPSFSLGGKAGRILLVAVALLAGGLAAFLALGRQPEPAPAPIVEQAAPAPEAPTLTTAGCHHKLTPLAMIPVARYNRAYRSLPSKGSRKMPTNNRPAILATR